MKAKIILTVSFVLLSGLILFLRFNQSGNASREDRTQGYPTIEKRITAPRFVSQDLKGRKVTLDDYKGKVVFLGFWTTQ
jgi:cytochrome oxidase Cu insertion factor (SCO1/SenC/PrrC family)